MERVSSEEEKEKEKREFLTRDETRDVLSPLLVFSRNAGQKSKKSFLVINFQFSFSLLLSLCFLILLQQLRGSPSSFSSFLSFPLLSSSSSPLSSLAIPTPHFTFLENEILLNRSLEEKEEREMERKTAAH